MRFGPAILVLPVLALLGGLPASAATPDRDAAPASAHARDAGWLPHARKLRKQRAEAVPEVLPLPLVPPGPTVGDWAREGWAGPPGIAGPQAASGSAAGPQAASGSAAAPQAAAVPWLRTAMEARVFLHGLPPADASSTRDRIETAAVVVEARRGRIFDNPRLQAQARRVSDYTPTPHYTRASLLEGEQEALDLLETALRGDGGR